MIKKVIFLSLVILATILVYSQSMKNGFVSWDDPAYITENAKIKTISWTTVGQAFTSFHNNLYKPLALSSFAVEYHFFRLNPFGYHVVSLILHLLNCVLVFLFIFLISRSVFISFLTMFLFAIHPAHVESVAWISEQKDLLYAFFFLASGIAYLAYFKNQSKKFYILSIIFFSLSLLAKPQGIVFPIILLVLDWHSSGKITRQHWLDKIPFFILAALVVTLNSIASYSSIIEGKTISFSLDGFFVACHGILFYISKLFVPIKLSCFYPYPKKILNLMPVFYLAAPFILAIVIFAVFKIRRYAKNIIFGSLFFVFTLMPVLPLAPLGPGISAADRYTYIPSIGIFYIVALGIVFMYSIFKNKKLLMLAWAFVVVFAFTNLCFLAYQRSLIWHDDSTLWGDVLKKYPTVVTANYNLSNYYFSKKDYPMAIAYVKKAIELDPFSWDCYFTAGNIYLAKSDFDGALHYFNKALEINPKEARIYNNLGVFYFTKGKDFWEQAKHYYEKAISTNPKIPNSFYNLGYMYELMGEKGRAVECFVKVLSIDPDSLDTLWRLAGLYAESRSTGKVLDIFSQIIENHTPGEKEYIRMGYMSADLGCYDVSEAFFNKAILLNQNSAEAIDGLARLCANMSRFDEAIFYFNKALKIRPGDEKLRNNLEFIIKRGEGLTGIKDAIEGEKS